MPKAFDKVWHKGLLHKLKKIGISGNLLNNVTDFVHPRKKRVVLNGQYSSWFATEAGAPHGPRFGPFFFLTYINKLSGDLVFTP